MKNWALRWPTCERRTVVRRVWRRHVGAALRQFLAAANKIAAQRKNQQTAKGRLRSIQDENVTSDVETLYDERWGCVDEDEFDEE